jgi:hypothetical protein
MPRALRRSRVILLETTHLDAIRDHRTSCCRPVSGLPNQTEDIHSVENLNIILSVIRCRSVGLVVRMTRPSLGSLKSPSALFSDMRFLAACAGSKAPPMARISMQSDRTKSYSGRIADRTLQLSMSKLSKTNQNFADSSTARTPLIGTKIKVRSISTPRIQIL